MKYAHELNLNFNQNHFTTIHTTTLTFEVVHNQKGRHRMKREEVHIESFTPTLTNLDNPKSWSHACNNTLPSLSTSGDTAD